MDEKKNVSNHIYIYKDGWAIATSKVAVFWIVLSIEAKIETMKWQRINTTSINGDDQTKIANDAYLVHSHTDSLSFLSLFFVHTRTYAIPRL